AKTARTLWQPLLRHPVAGFALRAGTGSPASQRNRLGFGHHPETGEPHAVSGCPWLVSRPRTRRSTHRKAWPQRCRSTTLAGRGSALHRGASATNAGGALGRAKNRMALPKGKAYLGDQVREMGVDYNARSKNLFHPAGTTTRT